MKKGEGENRERGETQKRTVGVGVGVVGGFVAVFGIVAVQGREVWLVER